VPDFTCVVTCLFHQGRLLFEQEIEKLYNIPCIFPGHIGILLEKHPRNNCFGSLLVERRLGQGANSRLNTDYDPFNRMTLIAFLHHQDVCRLHFRGEPRGVDDQIVTLDDDIKLGVRNNAGKKHTTHQQTYFFHDYSSTLSSQDETLNNPSA
jgi:hypothetical protein